MNRFAGLFSFGKTRSAAPEEPEESAEPELSEYERKLKSEREHFAGVENIHDLPPIFHYWSNTYVKPLLEEVGVTHEEEFFAKYLALAAKTCPDETPAFLSIGAGNGEIEIRLANRLRKAGVSRFVIECLDLNPVLLQRGRDQARKAGLADHLVFVEADFNTWKGAKQYAAVIANQALHHVLELEHLFDQVKEALRPNGCFIASDMIGRNGHQRWPEALEEVQRFWVDLPTEYRWNVALCRHEEEFMNYDCSADAFEGIRSQDVLPLLLDRFDFHVFIAFGNVINPFVDRSIGYSFDIEREWDREFIDRVHAFDEKAILGGNLTPTQMFAVMTPEPCSERHYSRGLSPQSCVRDESKVGFPLVVASASHLASGVAGAEHVERLSAERGRPPYDWSLTAGALPPGLHLDRSGVVSGRPSAPGISTFTTQVADSNGKTEKADFVLRIDPAAETVLALPHITCGGGWKSRLHLVNPSPSRLNISVDLRTDDGQPRTLPLQVNSAAGSRSLEAHHISATAEPYSELVVETMREDGAETPGWAEVRCSGPLMGHAAFDYRESADVTIGLRSDFPGAFLFRYDNTESCKVGVALANADHASSATVLAKVWNESWAPLAAEEIALPASGHASFLLAEKFPLAANRRGTIELRVVSGVRVSALAFRFDAEGQFFAIPVMSRPAAQQS